MWDHDVARGAERSRLHFLDAFDVRAQRRADRKHAEAEQEPDFRVARELRAAHEKDDENGGCREGTRHRPDPKPTDPVIRLVHAARIKTKARTARKLPLVVAMLFAGSNAHADSLPASSLRLRGDALLQQNTPSPVGLLVLHAEDKLRPWLDAETVSWLGITDQPNATGDVLSLSVRARDMGSGSEIRGGRMLVSMGAVRPLHLDGVRALGRVFGGTTAEAFAGLPVASRFDYKDFDFAAGGRLAQAFGDRAMVGVSYLQRRKDGETADEEVGTDVAITPARWLTGAGRVAYDLTNPGVTDALASLSTQKEDLRGEVFTTYRSPGRMLPSTSLFSMLGDFSSTLVGGTGRWRMFPRLEAVATGSGQLRASKTGGQGIGRLTLALDDEWSGTLGIEGRRVEFGDARWTGGRVAFSRPLATAWRVATEIELVFPDRPRGRGTVWPWALGAIAYRPTRAWDFGVAVEGSSGPEYRSAVSGLLRATWTFEGGGR